MSGRNDIRDAYIKKTEAELSALLERGVMFGGNAFSSIVLVKGALSPAELSGEALLGGHDGDALRAALIRLGYAPHDWCALASCNRDGEALPGPLLAETLAALSPLTLVACDNVAASALYGVLGDELDSALTPGVVIWARGIRVLSLGGFADALESGEDGRQRVWRWLKQIPPLAEPY